MSLINGSIIAQHKKANYFKPLLVNDQLSQVVNETSGLIYLHDRIWTINDGENAPCIYAIDAEGKDVVKSVCLKDVQNIDWEAITSDEKFVYVADVGDNKGIRNELYIYKIDKGQFLNDKVDGDIQKIIITYENKKENVTNSNSKWDCEAIVCIGDSLYMFSKNWEEPYCFIYGFSKNPGKYILKPIKKLYLDGLITDASYNGNTKALILTGYKDYVPFIVFFKKFHPDAISLKKVRRFDFQQLIGLQVEGVTFVNDSTVVLSSEYNPLKSGSLYEMNVPK